MAKSYWRYPEIKSRKQIGDLEKRILLLRQKNDCIVFSVAGCRGGEGVSSIIVNLVDYIGKTESGKNVLLVDANLQHPVLHDALGVNLGVGLVEVLRGSASWSDAVAVTEMKNIHFLSCGGGYRQLAGSVEQERMSKLTAQIRTMYDVVIIDSSPLLTSADALTTAVASDATFLVIQSHKTPKEVGERAKMLLHDNECFMGGVLLNRVRQVIPGWMYRLL